MSEMLEMFKSRVPVLVMVTVWVALTVRTCWLGKVSDVGESVVEVGAMPAVSRLTCQMPRPHVAARSVWVAPRL